MARATASAFSASKSATATSAPSAAKRRAMAPPISPPPPATSATCPCNRPLPSPAISVRRLHETAVEDRRLCRIRRFYGADFGQALGHLRIGRIRHVTVGAEQFQLGDQII